MVHFRLPVFKLLFALLLVTGRSWGQAVPEPLAHVLRQYQPLATSGARVAVGYRGTVHLPPDATQRRTGTKDSDRGEVSVAGLLIGYDIGKMSGLHLGPHNRGGDRYPGGNPAPFNVYEERTAGLLQATLGLRSAPGGIEVVATLLAAGRSWNGDPVSFPANFWAVVHSEAELRQFLAVVFSYCPVDKP